MKERICPICGKMYTDYPAISRQDNKTEICPACGVAEAFADLHNASLMGEATVTMNAEITFIVDKRSDNFMLFNVMSEKERELNFTEFIKKQIFADDVKVNSIKLFDAFPEVKFDGKN